MALRIIAFDDPGEMWQRLERDWRVSQGALLFAGGLARQRFEAGLNETVFASRAYTLPEFWQELAKKLDLAIGVIPSDLEEEVVASLTGGLTRLSELRGTSLKSLVAHLQKIEYEADRDFQATNDLEEEIVLLKKRLAEHDLYLQASFRTVISRQAKDIDMGYPLLVTHLPEHSRQLAGMLKGLSEKNDVFYYPLISEDLLDSYLKRAGFDDYQVEDNFKKEQLSRLFSQEIREQSSLNIKAKDKRDVTLFSSANEEELGLDLAYRLFLDKPKEDTVALVVPGSEKRRGKVIRLAEEHGIPLLFRRAYQAQETLIGSLLLSLSRAKEEDTLKESWDDICRDAQGLYLLQAEDLDILLSGDFLEELFLLGDRLLNQGVFPESEYLWFSNAYSKKEKLNEKGIAIQDPEAFFASVLSPRKSYGESILLLSPAEVPGYKIDHLVFLHLSADHYPGDTPASPFFSKELLDALPALGRKDERYTFLSALLAAQKSVSLVRDSKMDSSVYFQEVLRLGFREKYADSSLPRSTIKKMARERKAASEEIERALLKIAPEIDLEEEELLVKSDFAVTELERYLSCPLGWFVEQQIGPKKRINFQQRHGTALHLVMEDLFSYPFEERETLLPDVLNKHTDSFLSPRQRSFDLKNLRVLLDRYSGPAWPFSEHHLEQPFILESELADGDVISIRGRIDRLDLRDGQDGKEALLIDYKRSRAGGGDLLQIALYPLMAENNLGVDALGFLYVSILQGNHKGRLKRPIPGISDEGISYPLKEKEGLARAKEAIEGIRAGDWFRVGNKCPAWCSHRLLSMTKEIS